MYSKMKFFDKTSTGSIVNRLSDDVYSIDDELPWCCHVFLENVSVSLGYPIGILISFPWMAIFLILAISIVYFIQKLYRTANREIKRLKSVNSGKVLTKIGELSKGLIVIRAFGK